MYSLVTCRGAAEAARGPLTVEELDTESARCVSGLASRCDAEFREDGARMMVDRLGGQVQPSRYRRVREILGDERQDLELAHRQSGSIGAGRTVGAALEAPHAFGPELSAEPRRHRSRT